MRLLIVPLRCAALMAPISVGAARAAEIKLIAANALKESLVELLSAFEKSNGNKVAPRSQLHI